MIAEQEFIAKLTNGYLNFLPLLKITADTPIGDYNATAAIES